MHMICHHSTHAHAVTATCATFIRTLASSHAARHKYHRSKEFNAPTRDTQREGHITPCHCRPLRMSCAHDAILKQRREKLLRRLLQSLDGGRLEAEVPS